MVDSDDEPMARLTAGSKTILTGVSEGLLAGLGIRRSCTVGELILVMLKLLLLLLKFVIECDKEGLMDVDVPGLMDEQLVVVAAVVVLILEWGCAFGGLLMAAGIDKPCKLSPCAGEPSRGTGIPVAPPLLLIEFKLAGEPSFGIGIAPAPPVCG